MRWGVWPFWESRVAFGDVINKATKKGLVLAGVAVVFIEPDGTEIETFGVPNDDGLAAREGADNRQAGRRLVIEIPKADVAAVVKGSSRIRFPGSWVRDDAETVTWRVEELEGDATVDGSWICVMRK
jgi:hypothetical protein